MANKTVKVWDPAVRIFHWSLVIFFAISYLSAEEAEDLHAVSGYVISGLLAFRLLWGFIGTRHARFSDFVYGPGAVIGYIKSLFSGKPAHYLGHNPAGGLMIIALLIFLSATCLAGLKVYGLEGHGPLANAGYSIVSQAYANGDEDEEEARGGHEESAQEEFWEEVHEVMANFMLVLIFVHVSGVIVSSYLHKENLIKSMLTGKKEVF